MGKKHKKHGRGMAYGAAPQYGMPPYGQPQQPYGMPPNAPQQQGAAYWSGFGADPAAMPGATPDGMAAAFGSGLIDNSLLQGLPAFLRTRNTEQFLIGAVLGAAAAWLMSDEELRGKLVKAALKLYTGVAGGFEEMKEQMADIRAEVEAERHEDT